MMHVCLSCYAVMPIGKAVGFMDEFVKLNILKNIMMPYAKVEIQLELVFMHDNYPKNSSQIVKQQMQNQKEEIVHRPAQSPDLSPVENLMGRYKRCFKG